MTYDEFKTYLITFLWKKGDQVLIDNLDNLIKQGEATLNRELDEEYRHTSIDQLITDQFTPLPADYYSIRHITDIDTSQLGEFLYVSPATLKGWRVSTNNQWLPYYSIENTNVLFCGPVDTPTTDKNVSIDYFRKIRDFKIDGTSWLTDDNLDLLVYACLYHTAPFLREDERIAVWQGMYKDIITNMNEESAFTKERGVYDMMPLPRNASGRQVKGVRVNAAYKLHTRP